MTLSIHPADPDDVPALVELAARTFPLACPPDLSGEAIDAFIRADLGEASFRRYLQDPTHTVLVGRDPAGRICAYALLVDGTAMDETCAEMVQGRPTVGVSKFYLDPALHGSGGAVALLASVVRSARGCGAVSLWLATNVANARARAFYSRNGFRERGHRVFVVGGTRNDDVVYELPL